MRFLDQVAIVTGAAQGIGRDIALAFAREGACVAALDIDQDGLRSLAGEIGGDKTLVLPTDVTKSADIRRAIDDILARWQRVDVLVNNAGGFKELRRTDDIPDEEWDYILRFNLTSVFLCSKAVLPAMRQRRRGRIVNVSSWVGRGGAVTVSSHYAAAKAGIVGFTQHLAREAGPDGITVNAVAPGVVATKRFLSIRGPAEIARMVETIPARRLGETGDVAACVLFLASDAAAYVTGAVLDVNGGVLMR
jgi:3-oxoacyl-[acyl-carrier protein] reductase